jgi:CxxC-x17-CxxC domain-containing protein
MSFGRRGRFNRGSYGGRGSFEREMHKVTCADCGKETEVPFKPDGSKPVYCRECYTKRKGTSGGGERYNRGSYGGGERYNRGSYGGGERYNRGSYGGGERSARPERTNPMIMDLIEEIRADVKAIKEKIGA